MCNAEDFLAAPVIEGGGGIGGRGGGGNLPYVCGLVFSCQKNNAAFNEQQEEQNPRQLQIVTGRASGGWSL